MKATKFCLETSFIWVQDLQSFMSYLWLRAMEIHGITKTMPLKMQKIIWKSVKKTRKLKMHASQNNISTME